MDPDVDRGDRPERLEARRNALPADHHTTRLFLKPGQGALGLEPWDHFLARSAPVCPRLPDPRRPLRSDPTLPPLLPPRLRLIALLRCADFETCARAPPCARAPLDRLPQGHPRGALSPLGGRRTSRSGPPAPVGAA